MGCHSLLQGIFPSQRSNLGLLHCRKILYCLSPWGKSWLNLLQYCFRFLSCWETCGILVPWSDIKLTPPALQGEVLMSGPPGKSLVKWTFDYSSTRDEGLAVRPQYSSPYLFLPLPWSPAGCSHSVSWAAGRKRHSPESPPAQVLSLLKVLRASNDEGNITAMGKMRF